MKFVRGFGETGITSDGGLYTAYYAKETLAKGDVVYLAQGGVDGHVSKTPNGSTMPIGVVQDAVTYTGDDANMVCVVWGGVAVVRFDTTRTPIMGDVACIPISGGASGSARAYVTADPVDIFGEVGQVIASKATGTNLYKVQLQFN
jgi:hypothetical protein